MSLDFGDNGPYLYKMDGETGRLSFRKAAIAPPGCKEAPDGAAQANRSPPDQLTSLPFFRGMRNAFSPHSNLSLLSRLAR
jgi:hypothetical protein